MKSLNFTKVALNNSTHPPYYIQSINNIIYIIYKDVKIYIL